MDAQTQTKPTSAADKFRALHTQGLATLQEGLKQNVVRDIDRLAARADEVVNFKADKRAAEARLKILDHTLEDLKEMDVVNERGLAEAVLALNARLEALGQEYVTIENNTPAELAIIKAAEADVNEAKAGIETAKASWFFPGARAKAAQSRYDELVQALDRAKTNVDQMRRSRIMNAKIEQSLQEFNRLVEKTKKLMTDRLLAVNNQLTIVSARKLTALEAKKEANEAFETLDADFEREKANLMAEEQILQTMTAGSKEHTDQGAVVSDTKRRMTDAETARNNALVVFQSKEKFASILEVYEQSFLQMRGSLTMWISALQSDTEERVIVFRARLEGMKAHADQIAADTLDKLGAEVDRESVESVAAYGAAAARNAMKRVESMPERIRDVSRVRELQLEAQAQVMHRMAAQIAEFRTQYGIDPMSTNFAATLAETAPASEQSAA